VPAALGLEEAARPEVTGMALNAASANRRQKKLMVQTSLPDNSRLELRAAEGQLSTSQVDGNVPERPVTALSGDPRWTGHVPHSGLNSIGKQERGRTQALRTHPAELIFRPVITAGNQQIP